MTTKRPFRFEHDDKNNQWIASAIYDFAHAGEQAVIGVGDTLEAAYQDFQQECDDIGIPRPPNFE